MKAIVAARVGGPEVLELATLPDPRPGHGQVAIEVAYAGLNFAEVMGRRGDLDDHVEPFVLGHEVSGRVCELGAGVREFSIGQAVCAFVDHGGYAEQAIADASLTFPLIDDSDASLIAAACAPTVGITAWSLLRYAARLEAGESLLVHAAAGGLGSVLAQFARELGARRVIGTVGAPEKIPYAHRSGYDLVVLREDFARGVARSELAGIDVIVDSIGGVVREQSLGLLEPYGRLVVCGNAARADDFEVRASELMARNVAVVGYSIGWLASAAPDRVRKAGLEALTLLRRGIGTVDVTEVVEMCEIRDAHQRLESGSTRGKLVLRVGGRG
jgi:NADPH:quinone reductase